jgi:hypothetical protein
LPFLVRAERSERRFKGFILVVTGSLLVILSVATPAGRFGARMAVARGRMAFFWLLRIPPTREAIEARRQLQRGRDVETARAGLAASIPSGSPMGQFMRVVRMDPDSALIRWGNYDRTLVLSSALFEADDHGRSYRMKPNTRSIWVIGLSLSKALGLFLIPDTAVAREAAEEAGGRVVPESVQTTNSWGCRGPEPDPAPVRVLVLGDSCMEGALVSDHDAPPARLREHLAAALAAPVSVLNTGHLGYSPEQYYHTLRAFGDRFRPDYVIISICNNDFGDMTNAGNWDEAEYWLDRISELCMRRDWNFLLVPVPEETALLGRRNAAIFPGQVSRIFKRGGIHYVDPLEAFTEAQIRLRNEQNRKRVALSSPLYNGHLMGDRHFSPLGSDLWARVVARRLLQSWDNLVLTGRPGPDPVVRHARMADPQLPREEVGGE